MDRIDEIKEARDKLGLSLREAYHYVKGEIEVDKNQIIVHTRKNQRTLRTVWQEHCLPYKGCIVKARYGQHIQIKCQSCGAVGTTKNILFIGARTLFIDCKCAGDIRPVLPKVDEENLTNNVVEGRY